MSRRKIPDQQLTLEQRKRRERNEKYRQKKNETTSHNVIHLVKDTMPPSIPHNLNQSQKKSMPYSSSQSESHSTNETMNQEKHIETQELTLKKLKTLSKTAQFETKNFLTPQRYFLAYLGRDALALLLIAMIGALSYILITFQISAYKQISEFKGLETLTAVSIEVLLIVLSTLSMRGENLQKIVAGFLFVALSSSTVYLLHRSTKSEEITKTEQLESDANKSTNNNEKVVALKEKIATYNLKIKSLLLQLDPNGKNTYASKGENGNLKITKQEIAEAETKVDTLETELKLLEGASASKTLLVKQMKLVEDDTYFNLILRVILLLSSAFLVHVVLRRFDAFRSMKV